MYINIHYRIFKALRRAKFHTVLDILNLHFVSMCKDGFDSANDEMISKNQASKVNTFR